MSPLLLLGAVVGGWVLQTLLTYRQTTAFRRDTAALRRLGTVSIGSGGRRYRGGRAFVAIAVDGTGRVRGALELRGWTTFSRARPLPAAAGHRVRKLAAASDIPGLDPPSRSAARQAAQLFLDATARRTAEQSGPEQSRPEQSRPEQSGPEQSGPEQQARPEHRARTRTGGRLPAATPPRG